MAQLGTLANFIAYACMGIPAGIILKRKGYKFTSSLAVTVGFVGVGIPLTGLYWWQEYTKMAELDKKLKTKHKNKYR